MGVMPRVRTRKPSVRAASPSVTVPAIRDAAGGLLGYQPRLPGMEPDMARVTPPRPPVETAPGHSIAINVDSPNVPGVAAHGVLNQFHPVVQGQASTNKGSGYGSARRDTEGDLFGIPRQAGFQERPTYGYLRLDGDYSSGRAYGDTVLDVTPPKGAAVTTTDGDSFGFFQPEHVAPLGPEHQASTRNGYREVQVHAPVISPQQFSGAALVHYTRPGQTLPQYQQKAVQSLRAAGIPVRFRTPARQFSLWRQDGMRAEEHGLSNPVHANILAMPQDAWDNRTPEGGER